MLTNKSKHGTGRLLFEAKNSRLESSCRSHCTLGVYVLLGSWLEYPAIKSFQ